MRKKKTFWILGASLALLAGGAILFFFLLADEAPSPDEDLRVFRRNVVDADNGFLLVNAKKEDVVWPEENEEIKGWSQHFDPERAAEVIEKNVEILKRLEESLKTADFQGPEMRSVDDRVPYLIQWRSLAYLASCRNRWLLESGREKEAIEGALQLMHFGWRIEGSQGALINYLVGIAIHSIGIQDLLRAIARTQLESSELKQYIAEVARYPPSHEGLCDAYRTEYSLVSNSWESSDKGFFAWLLSRKPFFKPNQANRMLAEALRNVIQAVPHPASRRGLIDPETKYASRDSEGLFRNLLAKFALVELIPNYKSALLERDRAEVHVSGAQVLLALECFDADYGYLPDSLSELVPEYLTEVPRDPFDGSPLRYSEAKRIVYSIGNDLKDSGGSSEEDAAKALWDRSEPTLRIEF